MDTFLWIAAAISQALIGFLGFYLSMRPSLAEKHSKSLVSAFVLLTIIGLVAAGCGAVRAARSGEAVAQLTQRILHETTGSPDAYLVVFPHYGEGVPAVQDRDATLFHANNISGLPMIGVSVAIFNATKRASAPDIYTQNLGDVYRGGGGVLGYVPALKRDVDNRFTIFVRCRAVDLRQETVITWTGKMWVHDYSLESTNVETKAKKTIKKIRDDFPYIDPPANRNAAEDAT